MPHYRTRAMLVARGAQPQGSDRRLPSRPLPQVLTDNPIVNVTTQVDLDVNVDADVDVTVTADADRTSMRR